MTLVQSPGQTIWKVEEKYFNAENRLRHGRITPGIALWISIAFLSSYIATQLSVPARPEPPVRVEAAKLLDTTSSAPKLWKPNDIVSVSSLSYCAGIENGLQEYGRWLQHPNIWELDVIIRRFGGEMIGPGQPLIIQESLTNVSLLRAPVASTLCYLPSSLLQDHSTSRSRLDIDRVSRD